MSLFHASWASAPLKFLASEMCLGKMLDKGKNRGEFQPYLGNINVRWFSFDLADLKRMRLEEPEFERYQLLPGDLVICEGGEPGRAAVWNGQRAGVYIQKALHRVRFSRTHYLPKFAMYFLFYGTVTDRFARDYTGTTIKHLTGKALARVQFPLPPLAEQARVVEKLDELLSDLDAGVKALEGVRAKLKQYRAAVLKAAVDGTLTAEWRKAHPDAEPAARLLDHILAERRRRWEEAQLQKFKDAGKTPPKDWSTRYPATVSPIDCQGFIVVLPEGWARVSFDQLALSLRSGSAQTSGRRVTGRPVLKSSAVRHGQIDYSDLNYYPELGESRADNYLARGDFLITRLSGSVDYVGCSAVVGGSGYAGVQYPDRIFCAKLAEPSMGIYLTYCFRSAVVRKMLEAAAKSTAGHQRISISDLVHLAIPIPPPAEQHAIVELVESQLSVIDHIESDLDAKLASAAALRQSILKSAFEGKLVPQDPNDEPAVELLKRIAAERAERQRLAKEAKAAEKKAARIGKGGASARPRKLKVDSN